MASTESISLNREEVRQIVDLLADFQGDMPTRMTQDDKQQYFRLLVKLDKALGKDARWGGPFSDQPDWIREILHRTFTPQPAPAKKKPAAKPTAKPATVARRAGKVTVPAELTASATRRRGGLLRAAQVAQAKGDHAAAAQYRTRAAQLVASAQSVTAAAGSGPSSR